MHLLDKNHFQFAYLDSKSPMWLSLFSKFNNPTTITGKNVFVNAYSYDSTVYVENRAVNDEAPSLMVHHDDTNNNNNNMVINDDQSLAKCVYGHQVIK